MGEGPTAHPHQPPDSGAQGPGARPKALSCRHPHLGWFSVGVRRLEEARATGLACRGAHSHLLTRSSLHPSVVSCSLLPLVGRVCIGSVVVFCCVRGYDLRWVWRTMVLPARWAPFPFRPVHAWLVWCWPACVWSVYGQVAAAAAVLLARGRLGRLIIGMVCVGSIALLPVVVPPHVVYAAGMSVSVLVNGVVVCPSVMLCSLLQLVGRVCIGSVVAFCCVRGYDRRWGWRTTVLPTSWAPFPFRPVHAWLVRRWPACVWSVYGQVVAAAVVSLVRGCRGRLMVGWVCVWGLLRCCWWSYHRILPVWLARLCLRRFVVSWFVQVSRSVVWECSWAASAAVESQCSSVLVAMVVGGRGSLRCHWLVRRRSRTGPCTPCQVGAGRCARGLFTVTLRPP